MAAPLPKLRQDLSMPGLVACVRRCFAKLEDPRRRQRGNAGLPEWDGSATRGAGATHVIETNRSRVIS